MLDLSKLSNSNDSIEVVIEDNLPVVKKYFESNIGRAEKCYIKQKNSVPLVKGTIKVSAAPINYFEVNENLATLCMPFIEGINGEDFVVYGTKSIANYLSNSLSAYIYNIVGNSYEKAVDKKLFIDKIKSIKSLNSDEVFNCLLDKSILLFSRIESKINFPIGLCHGDLTLSNVIHNPLEGLILIDYLDVYLDSPLQDIAKINQDFIYGWSFRHSSITLQLKSQSFCNAAYPEACQFFYKKYSIQIEILTLLALLKIIPYITDNTTKLWILKNLPISLKKCETSLNF